LEQKIAVQRIQIETLTKEKRAINTELEAALSAKYRARVRSASQLIGSAAKDSTDEARTRSFSINKSAANGV
jgi:hypothetical protein